MFSFFALVALAVIPTTLAQGGLTINTPSDLTVCEPAQFTWSGGTAPYFMSLIPAGQTTAPAIKQFPQTNDTSLTWKVDVAQGTSFNIALKDETGKEAFSDQVTVQTGPDSSCVNTAVFESVASGGSAPSSGRSAPTSAGPSSASTPAATNAAPKSSSAPPSAPSASAGASAKPSSASSSAASPTPSSNAASNIKGNAFALAGLMGLLGAVLF